METVTKKTFVLRSVSNPMDLPGNGKRSTGGQCSSGDIKILGFLSVTEPPMFPLRWA